MHLYGRQTGGGHPDYYTHEAAAGSRSISSRSRKRQQEPDYCQNLTHPRITIRAHAAGQHPPRLPGGGTPAGRLLPQLLPQTTMYAHAAGREERSPRVYVTSAISSRRITCMQQENTAVTKATKKTLQKLQNLTKFCQILTQNQSKPTKKFAF